MTTTISLNQTINFSCLTMIPKELIIYKFKDYFYNVINSCKLFLTSKLISIKFTKITVIDPNEMRTDLINMDHNDHNKLIKLPNSLFQYDDIVNTFQNDSISSNTSENNINRMLHYAVKSGHTDLVKWLLINGADPNYIDELGNHLLHFTVINKHLQIFQLLIDFGAKVDMKNRLGAQAIHLACEADFLEGLELLLEITVDPNTPDEQGATPVHYCCFNDSAACLQFLIQAGGSIYQPDALGKYPIHEAISQLSIQCVKILLEFNQYDIQQHDDPTTAVTVPSWHKYHSSVPSNLDSYKFASIFSRKYSILSNNFTEKSKKIIDSFEFSTHQDKCNQRINNQSKIKQLINLLDGEGLAPIHTAANSGSFELLNKCLQYKPDILVKDNNGQTVLHYAALRGDLECMKLIIENIKLEEQIKLIHCINDNEETCLHIAAKHNFVNIVDYLINLGAQINQSDINGYTPIMSAAIKGSVNTCNYLLNNGAELKHHDVKHRNLLHLLVLSCFDEICDSNETLKNLTVLPELLNDPDNYGCTPLHYAIELGLVETSLFCLRYGAKVTIVNMDKSSSLHLAAKFGRLRISQAILNTNGGMRTLYMADSKGCLPLHIAAYYGQDKLLELFLRNGCLFRRCHEGNTALHYAAMQGNVETCRLLLEINPTLLNQTNYNGMTALHIAAIKDNSRAVEYLLSNSAEIKADHNGSYFLNYAITGQNEATVREIVFHKRWPEIVELLSNTTHCPFKELLEYMPDICLTLFDFTILQPPLKSHDKQLTEPLQHLKMMILYKRDNLLVHPLCKMFLKVKWTMYGRWIHLIITVYYVILNCAITLFCLKQLPLSMNNGDNQREHCIYQSLYRHTNESRVNQGILIFILLMSLSNMFIQCFQIVSKDKNVVQSVVSQNCSVTTASNKIQMLWLNCNNKSVFQQLFQLPDEEVLNSLSNNKKQQLSDCFIGYKNLLNNSINNMIKMNRRQVNIFNSIGLTFFNTLMMMMGEYQQSTIMIVSYLENHLFIMPHSKLTLVFFIVFIILIPITLYNLTIGLAVGDIDKVRQSATHELISRQVYWLDSLEAIFPRWFYDKVCIQKWKIQSAIRNKPAHRRARQEMDEVIKLLNQKLNIIHKKLEWFNYQLQQIMQRFSIQTLETLLDTGCYDDVS
ncbi:hypothetical protein MN116_004719 [Schistosoma mekongi]|uniref:Transient receptor potential cation channel subfamily A member 1 n=1 Tax=Schistosoma mekongi TaxID=38744 RepID=A0AAE1ZBJ5_SCHME|nr:hypothetical protein MN116_004719 [Schistosoma mekongi]